ncbi:MAG: M23 family metallopeptidase [Balneolaceae bacterium]|jgi:murein DD-endopeptidase MepM/ murein hydrolase activator NlpD|nr:MAG: M23 family metallopeptidase [Balneolaceae bacterium]
MSDNYYYFDKNACEFKKVEYNPTDRVIHTISLWLLTGLVISGIIITSLSTVVGTPAEIALKAENRELLTQMRSSKDAISKLNLQIESIAERDNEIYRSVLGMEPIAYDERLAGAGGADIYNRFDNYSNEASELLKWSAANLETLERRVGIQRLSLDEIKSIYNNNQQRLSHLPVMRPVDGMILSNYGMRMHPVLKMRLMHEGMDFRANIGTPVFATGNGTIRFAGNRGTLGLLIEIDHSHGYITRYAHLSKLETGIRSGTKVNRGDLIGYSGNSGRVSGPHLHYEILKNGRSVDPIQYLFTDITPQEYLLYKRMSEEDYYADAE